MASLKEVKGRIASVKSTQKITQAMKMVASAKLHKAQSRAANASLYLGGIESLLARLLMSVDDPQTPYTHPDAPGGRTALVVISSNTGMCGAFNANIIRQLHESLEGSESAGVLLFPIGRKVRDWLVKTGYRVGENYNKLVDGFDEETLARMLTEKLVGMYLSGEVDRVEILYHRFHSASKQEIVRERMLPFPIERIAAESGGSPMDNYLLEPSLGELIESLTLRVVGRIIPTAALNSYASEQRARTVAMQIATENADEILEQLEIEYNKLRQYGITAELLDIIGGSFA